MVPENTQQGATSAQHAGAGSGAHAEAGTNTGPGTGRGADDTKPPVDPAASLLPSVTLPKGGGALKGIGEKTSVNAAYGTATVSVPLPFSASRADLVQAGLTYDSGTGNGPFGFGWSLGVPSIARKTDKGMPKYGDGIESDIFIFAGADDLVPVLAADGSRMSSPRTLFGVSYRVFEYRPRVEGAFAKIERWSSAAAGRTFWRTISRDNVTSVYGYEASSCVADPRDATRIFSWQLSRSWDDRGNAALYSYVAEDSVGLAAAAHEANRTVAGRAAQIYLKAIFYGNTAPFRPDWTAAVEQPLPSAWAFKAVLDFGDHTADPPTLTADGPWAVRPDPFSTYRSGFEVRTYRRVQRFLFFNDFPDEPTCGADRLVRSLQFTYSDQQSQPDTKVAEYTMLTSVASMGFGDAGASRAMPPLAFTYTRPVIQPTLLTLDRDSLNNLPEGIDGVRHRLIDLDGEGLPGILVAQDSAWYYKRNWSANFLQEQSDTSYAARARFGPMVALPALPTSAVSAGLVDLSGSGMLDLVEFDGAAPGFFKRTADNDWEPMQSFASLPEVDYADPNLKFIDLTGDGLADLLITEDGLFTFYASLGEDGFDVAQTVRTPWDEEKGPKVVLADGTQTIFVADMSGDGLNDIVRVRNGEVSYWPNIGYGRFGARVTMDGAPRYGTEEEFDPTRVRLADVDGTGSADVLYVDSNGVRLWFNQAGNAFSSVNLVAVFPAADELSTVHVLDLLGTGTACLVWSTPLSFDASMPLRYVDLMGGRKPHLLSTAVNNLGAETRLTYAPSTRFYRDDADAGTPWVTRLPFPVQVVERIETLDWIGRNRFVSRYAYHHGYFDGYEREFRGFGRVEQWDTEEFRSDTNFAEGEFQNWNAASLMLPVLTVSWFHTGVYLNEAAVSLQFASEYWKEPAQLAAGTAGQMSLPDSVLPNGLDAYELQEAYRALKGSPLRVEVYADDGPDPAMPPLNGAAATAGLGALYSVVEHNYSIVCLQPRGVNLHGVFRVDPRESLKLAYERANADPTATHDPRATHDVILECDAYGNPLRQVSIAYGRRPGYATPEPLLGRTVQTALAYDQGRLHVRATESVYTNAVDDSVGTPGAYRTPLPCEGNVAELTGIAPKADTGGVTNRFSFDELDGIWQSLWTGANDIPYEQVPASDLDGAGAPSATPARRMLSRTRTVYRSDDLTLLLPLGTLEPMALPGQTCKAAFTATQLAAVYGASVTAAMLQGCGYVQLAAETDQPAAETDWWMPSGLIFYSPNASDTTATELAEAQANYFLPRRAVDPFGGTSLVTYDEYCLLTESVTDAVGNTTTAVNNYRVLSPAVLTDANSNQSAVLCDALGFVTATALMGKASNAPNDNLDGLVADLTAAEVAAQFADPTAAPAALLGSATARLIYDLEAYLRTAGTTAPAPAAIYTLARETHVADLAAGQTTQYQYALSYSDGFGRVVQAKKLVAPGPLTDGAAPTSPRWAASGWTILNNKGKPVRTYEPFFSAASDFEFAVKTGVSTVLLYDTLGRQVGSLRPDATWTKIVIEGWRQETWDSNDTVLADPSTDPVIGSSFVRLPEAAVWTSWYAQRIGGTYGSSADQQAAQYDAAKKTEAHSGTFSVSHLDSLGRTCLAVVDNGGGERYPARTAADTQGKPLVVFDMLGRRTQQYCLEGLGGACTSGMDMAGQPLYASNTDAGERRVLANVAGHASYAWDARGHAFRTVYDAAQRKTQRYVSTDGAAEQMLDLIVYGEGMPEANLCGRVFRQYDGAGYLENTKYDFKGNLVSAARQLAAGDQGPADWSALASVSGAAALDSAAAAAGLVPTDDGGRDLFVSLFVYDALNRQLQTVTAHNTSMQPNVLQQGYDQGGYLVTQNVWLQQANLPGGLLDPATADRHTVTAVETNARGQRTRFAFGNGSTTEYTYDPMTFRMIALTTARPATFAASFVTVQELLYFYDPVGNTTHIRDDADTQNVIFFANQRVEPSNDYTYDPLYRLITAQGREHLGQTGGSLSAPQQVTNDDSFRMALPQPGDGKAMGTYTEIYVYDAVGNILSLTHATSAGNWVRRYSYAEASWIWPGEMGNRLSGTTLPGDAATGRYSAGYSYDTHGNMTSMPHLPAMTWDPDDRLQSTARQSVQAGTPATTYYTYNSGAERVRKSSYLAASAGVTPARTSERINLGGIEVYREFTADGTVSLARETLMVADGTQTTAIVETRTAGSDAAPQQQVRYQYGNHLGSAVLELDDAADIVSYEEYFPYGSTSYQAVASQTDLPKRYRYTGKERDQENDLYYHGARYYAPWLGRWISCDPQGIADGPDLYVYGHDAPLRFVDSSGLAGEDSQLWLNHQLTQDKVATRSTRGFDKKLTGDLQKGSDAFGPGGPIDAGHPADQPFATMPAGTHSTVRAQDRSENRSAGASSDKAARAQAAAEGKFVREGNVDPTVPKGTKFGQPPERTWRPPLRKWNGPVSGKDAAKPLIDVEPAKLSQELKPLAKPGSTSAWQQLELPSKPPTAVASAPPAAAAPHVSSPVVAAAEVSVGRQVLEGAVELAHGTLEVAGQLATVAGAASEAGKTYDREIADNRGKANATLAAASTFIVSSAAGLVDDALAAATIEIGSAPVLDSWEHEGAGPTQHLAGEALRDLFHANRNVTWSSLFH